VASIGYPACIGDPASIRSLTAYNIYGILAEGAITALLCQINKQKARERFAAANDDIKNGHEEHRA